MKKIYGKLLNLISFLSLIMLLVPQDILGIFLVLIIVLLLEIFSNYQNKENANNDENNDKIPHIISFIAGIILLFIFYFRWSLSNRVFLISEQLRIDARIISAIAGIVLLVFSRHSIFKYFNRLYKYCRNISSEENFNNNVVISKSEIIVCAICSVAIITLCSKSSFLYPINDWVDSNVYFTIGKSMFDGKVIYRDLFDQKGPLIYFIHAFASVISYKSFIGMYFVEIIACFFFLLYSLKIIKLYINRSAILIVPVLCLLVYTADAYCHGDSAEELCLPFIAYTLYVSTRAIKSNCIMSIKESFLIGVFAGCVFWTKFTLVGCFVGTMTVPSVLMIKNKQYKELLTIYLFIFLGIVIATIPYLIYFGINNSINDLIEVYFYDNLFGYTSDVGDTFISKMIYGMRKGYINIRTFNEINGILILLGLLWALFTKKAKEYIHILLIVFISFFFVYAGGKGLAYYSLILSPLAIWGVIFVYQILNSKFRTKSSVPICTILIFTMIVFSVLLSSNNYMLLEKKENMPQYKFAEIIKRYDNPTLINYGFLDGGFYTTTGIVPNCRSFCITNFPSKELTDLQSEYCEKGLCDFIVTRDSEISFDKYEKISECEYYYEREIHPYYLYKLKTIEVR